jgi:hypothetical protein
MSGAPWRNPRVISILICVFLSGAAAGALTVRLGYTPERKKPPSSGIWSDGREFHIDRMKRELDLTPEQAKEIERIVDDFMMYYQTLQAQMNDVRATGKQHILQILREDQRERFKRMIEVQKADVR